MFSFVTLLGAILFFTPTLNFAQAQAACDPNANITRVSVASDGTQGNEFSGGVPYLSGDGRFVSFWSGADNLVPNDTNNLADAFVYDRQTCTTHRVSVSSAGVQSNDTSYTGPLSADGRYAAYISAGSNLVANDIFCGGQSSQVSECFDIFVHDLQTAQTVRVSVASDGTPANNGSYNPQMSPDGRYILFDSPATNLVSSDTNNVNDVFLHDRDADNDGIFDEAGAIETIRVSTAFDGSQSNDSSYYSSVSADGRYITFTSQATNLVSADTNNQTDIFVYDRQTSTTTLASIGLGGVASNSASAVGSISNDGHYVAFESAATNLINNDNNNRTDVFVRDLELAQTSRISIAYDGTQTNIHSGNPSISGNGRYVVFESQADNLVVEGGAVNGIYVHDLQTGQTVLASLSYDRLIGSGYFSNISADGSVIAFASDSAGLVPNDTNTCGLQSSPGECNDIFAVRMAAVPPPQSPPPPPAIHFTLRNIRTYDTTPELSWFAVQDAQNYQIQLDTDFTFASPDFDATAAALSFTPATPLEDGVYYWRVRWLNATTTSAWTSLSKLTIDAVWPAPELTSPVDNGYTNDTRPVFQWNAIDTPFTLSYEVQLGTVNPPTVTVSNASGLSYRPSSPLAPGVYYWRVRGNNSIIYSPWSDVYKLTIIDSLPTPTILAPADNAISVNPRPTFTWEANPAAAKYILYLDTTNPPTTDVYYDTSASYTPTSDLADGVYYWQVQSQQGTVNSPRSEVRTLTITSTLPAPTILAPADNATSSNPRPTFSWQEVIGATGYEIQLGTANPPTATVYSGSDTSYTPASDLENGVYYWRVRAQKDSDFSDWSDIRTLTINTVPNVPTLISPADGSLTTGRTPTFSWNAVTDAVNYEIQIGRDNPPNTQIIVVGETNYTPPDDLLTTAYYWRVRAKDADGDVSEWSAIFVVTIESESIAVPNRNLFSTGMPTLTWNPTTDAIGYHVQVARDSNFMDIVYENPNIPSSALEVTFTPALSDGVYYWRVRAVKSSGADNWSAAQVITVDAP